MEVTFEWPPDDPGTSVGRVDRLEPEDDDTCVANVLEILDIALDTDNGILVLNTEAPEPAEIVTGKAVMVVTYPSELMAGVRVVVQATGIVVAMSVVLVDVV